MSSSSGLLDPPSLDQNRRPKSRKLKASRIRRSKTFSGCWTCRSRHVKCDEGRPTCARCRLADIPCQGFDLRLSWHDTDAEGPTSAPLRMAPTGNGIRRSDIRSPARIQADLDAIDGAQLGPGDSKTRGLFSVFSSVPDKSLRSISRSRSTEYEGESGSEEDLTYGTPLSLGSKDHDLSSLQLDGYTSGSSIKKLILSEPSIQHSIPWRRLDILSCSARQRRIIHHWVDHLCQDLLPATETSGLLSRILLPIALDGFFSTSQPSRAAQGLLHLICSASASHLAHVCHQSEGFEDTALRHHTLSLRNLRQNIETTGSDQLTSILASLVAFLATESIRMNPTNWHTHMIGGWTWANNISGEFWCASESSVVLCRLFAASFIFSQSQQLYPSCSLQSFKFWEKVIKNVPKTGMTCGIPREVMDVILWVQNHSLLSNDFALHGIQTAQLELMQFLYQADCSALDAEEAIQIHAKVMWYSAGLIYMARTANKVSSSTPLIQYLTMRGVEGIEGQTTERGQPLVWPVAIIAFEVTDSGLQHRISTWLLSLSNRGYKIWQTVRLLALELWNIRSRDDGRDFHWQDLVQSRPEFSLMLL